MRGLKTLLATSTLLAAAAFAAQAASQVVIGIGIQPVCSYGYYDYAPYGCAPAGFYGSGYFYNGVFLGMGPWAGWGYSHGWGEHRFVNSGGGRYTGGGGYAANHITVVHNTNTTVVHDNHTTVDNTYNNGASNAKPAVSGSQAAPAHTATPKAAPHSQPSHTAQAHGGGAPHGSGGGGHPRE